MAVSRSWPAAVIVGAYQFVLTRVAPHPDPQDQPTPAESLEGCGLFGHGHGTPERKLDHTRSQGRMSSGGGRHGQDEHALEARAVPEQVVAGPQGVGSGLLGPPAQIGQLDQGIDVRSDVGGVLRPRRDGVLDESGQDESDGP